MDTFLYPSLDTRQVMSEEGKVQFREDPALLRFVRARGLNPNDVARQAFTAEVAKMRSDDWLARLRELQKGMRSWKPGDMAQAVRESRNEH